VGSFHRDGGGGRVRCWRYHHAGRPTKTVTVYTPEIDRKAALGILGLDEGANRVAIRGRYHALLKRIHPDNGGTAQLAAIVNEAHDVLEGRPQ
jgi:hypothetical protein